MEVGISSCFPEGDKFGVGHGHALSFQQQVMQVLVATAASEQTRDVAVHCFHNSHRYFGVAVVENALQTDRAASGPASQTASTAAIATDPTSSVDIAASRLRSDTSKAGPGSL